MFEEVYVFRLMKLRNESVLGHKLVKQGYERIQLGHPA